MDFISKEEEVNFKCNCCGRNNSYTAYIERGKTFGFVQLIGNGNKVINCNNTDVEGNNIIINEVVHCQHCNSEIKIYTEYEYPFY